MEDVVVFSKLQTESPEGYDNKHWCHAADVVVGQGVKNPSCNIGVLHCQTWIPAPCGCGLVMKSSCNIQSDLHHTSSTRPNALYDVKK
jgi:hypothetical protein